MASFNSRAPSVADPSDLRRNGGAVRSSRPGTRPLAAGAPPSPGPAGSEPSSLGLVGKRALDVLLSSVGLVLLAPAFALIAVAIKIDSRGPVFFRQVRMGARNRKFLVYKFRTMVLDADERKSEFAHLNMHALNGGDPRLFKIVDDPRVTRFGRVLRRTSLDELPQLVNVLKGDMSLVGPRPEQLNVVARYRPEHRFRLDVKPGITGPMQVFGRGQLTFEERLAVEREYIENLSIGRDLRILAMTAAAVVSGKGAF